ncbi:MAG: hypothetical protein PW789_04755 [Edaphobacter sp.]|uniref:hypothetical protein n=1 Tax=Edaphobacter sp. TaxID=1934404 RepID=UPI0023A3A0ED|nr:hypothetical protein [Edaphobacter sp.]MDE1175897.1 hypothetical protein [Edaphobacter sp.]
MIRARLLLIATSLCISGTLHAQVPQAVAAMPSVPTTKILAIGSLTGPMTAEQRATIMPHEVPQTVQLYLNGKIDQWWFREDGKGVVFLMNVTSVDEARALLEQLPLGKAKLMEFEYMPLGPLAPLRVLLKGEAK